MFDTVLVTGSAGFIGFHVSQKLLEKGVKVIGFDNLNSHNYESLIKENRNQILEKNSDYQLYQGNLENLELVKKVFKENKIDKVCHLAALSGVLHSIDHPDLYIAANVVGFNNIIDEAKNANVKNFVYASSSSVYGGNEKLPSSVEDRTDQPLVLYAATKKSNEVVAYTYHHLFGLNCTGLRFFNVYGPWGRPDTALFIFTKGILENTPIKVFNYGNMYRDFVHIDDVVNGIISSLNSNFPYEIFNIGSGKLESLLVFIEEIEKSLGKKAKKNMLPIQTGEISKSYADLEKSEKLLGYKPVVSIEKGVPEFAKWYKEYYNY